VYDRIGHHQDSQRFYEDPAVDCLVDLAGLAEATTVFELGSGTGRLARRLLSDYLPPTARYTAVDVSPTMVRLTLAQLRPWVERTESILLDGNDPLPAGDESQDRVIATYVFDLLDSTQTTNMLDAARRVLRPDGLLCIVGLTAGTTSLARLIDRAWMAVWRRTPAMVGGCRPITMTPTLVERDWQIEHREIVTAWGRSSEIIVAGPPGR